MNGKKEVAYTIGVNEISRAKTFTGGKAIALQLVRLILLRPGTNPLYPEMGVGLHELCIGKTRADLPDIDTAIDNQIEKYLPEYSLATIELSVEDGSHGLVIDITIDDEVYRYDTSDTDIPIYLSDFIKEEH